MPTYGHYHLSRDCNCAATSCHGALLPIILQTKPKVRKIKKNKKADLRSLPPVAQLQLCCRVVLRSAAAHHTAKKT